MFERFNARDTRLRSPDLMFQSAILRIQSRRVLAEAASRVRDVEHCYQCKLLKPKRSRSVMIAKTKQATRRKLNSTRRARFGIWVGERSSKPRIAELSLSAFLAHRRESGTAF